MLSHAFLLTLFMARLAQPRAGDKHPHTPKRKKSGNEQMIKRYLTMGLLCLGALAAQAQEEEQERGSETNLAIPRYVSIKSNEANIRRGPGMTHRIDWVFQHRNMPVQVIDEYGHWRRVIDRDGAGGWIHYSLITGTRYVIIEEDMLPLHHEPDNTTRINAYLEIDVIARLEECILDWCKLNADGHRGWAPKTALWGVDPDEVFD